MNTYEKRELFQSNHTCQNQKCSGYTKQKLYNCEVIAGNGIEQDAMVCEVCETVYDHDELVDWDTELNF
ncbi:MAG: hypothetical protein Unbinned400contig1004_31 [Prokaryotic dsDNA virus sp.]|nr:MAG: hypothetical protein Unbinned400contig1004_31 [Prokaryotic dsDNA virus sp.]